MPFNLGTNRIKNIYLGSTKVKAVMLGTNRIWSSITEHINVWHQNGVPVYTYSLVNNGSTLYASLRSKPVGVVDANTTNVGWQFDVPIGATVTIDWSGQKLGEWAVNDLNVYCGDIMPLTQAHTFDRITQSFTSTGTSVIIACHSHDQGMFTDGDIENNLTVYNIKVNGVQLFP